MPEREMGQPGTRQDRRKAVTRAKIQRAAETLFGERGYSATSIEDISEVADVAVRTIYSHFPSKAAIMLDYFDSWVDAFVAAILTRPVREPVVESVRAALDAMTGQGWIDRVENAQSRVHPLVEHLDSGPLDVAGHILQRWMREIDHLTDDARTRGDYPDSSLEPRARAVAVFAAWIAATSAARARDRSETPPENATGNGLGLDTLELITRGNL